MAAPNDSPEERLELQLENIESQTEGTEANTGKEENRPPQTSPEYDSMTAKLFVRLLTVEDGVKNFVTMFFPQADEIIDWNEPTEVDSESAIASAHRSETGHLRITIDIKATLISGEKARMSFPIEV